jgi:hypothetical protein
VATNGRSGFGPIVPTENIKAAVHSQNTSHPEMIIIPKGGIIKTYGVPPIN